MNLTNKEIGRMDRLRDRCTILKARLHAGLYKNPTDIQMELSAIEWAIDRINGSTREVLPLAPYMALMVVLNHIEPGFENCREVLKQWFDALPKPDAARLPQKSERT